MFPQTRSRSSSPQTDDASGVDLAPGGDVACEAAAAPPGERPGEPPQPRPDNGSAPNEAAAAPVGVVEHSTPAKVLAVANQKGGVGKTTTAVNVAACIAQSGQRTLLIDVDPQANATVGLGLAKQLAPSVYDVLCGDCAPADAIHQTSVPGLFLMPAGAGLAGANVELPRLERSEFRLREALTSLRDQFRFVLLDCPPSLGPLTVAALAAADRLLVPVQTEYYALEGLAQLLDTVGLVQRELNPTLSVAGMLLTMHDGRTRLGRDVEREVREHFPDLVFDTVIPRNVRISEAPSYGVPITRHDPLCAGSLAYVSLAREVAARA